MGMSAGGVGKAVSEINVTPLIDVLLVLLIIFMVIVPVTSRGLGTLLPQAPNSRHPDSTQTIVLQVKADQAGEPLYLINGTTFPKSDIQKQLAAIFSLRSQRVMFVQADQSLDFSKVAEVIDMGHQAEVDNIGLITPRVDAGH